jgi:hypothetical protein
LAWWLQATRQPHGDRHFFDTSVICFMSFKVAQSK